MIFASGISTGTIVVLLLNIILIENKKEKHTIMLKNTTRI